MTNIIRWNVRGMNGDIRTNKIQKCITNNKLGMIGLVETKVKEENSSWIARKIRKDWQFVFNHNADAHGRIWLGWNPTSDNVVKIAESKQMVVALATNLSRNFSFMLVMIYASNDLGERMMLWEKIIQTSLSCTHPLIPLGDFNNVLHAFERIGGYPVQA